MAWRYVLTTTQRPTTYAHAIFVACFNICTGDIGSSHAFNPILLLIYSLEDAPAPAAIHSFQTHITDGKIHVTADPANTIKDKLSRSPKLLSSGSEVGGAGVVIVGGGSGAFHATESLREASPAYLRVRLNRNLTFHQHGYKAPITILSQETNAPIDRYVVRHCLTIEDQRFNSFQDKAEQSVNH
jgi:apoptosis-inducing factor 3